MTERTSRQIQEDLENMTRDVAGHHCASCGLPSQVAFNWAKGRTYFCLADAEITVKERAAWNQKERIGKIWPLWEVGEKEQRYLDDLSSDFKRVPHYLASKKNNALVLPVKATSQNTGYATLDDAVNAMLEGKFIDCEDNFFNIERVKYEAIQRREYASLVEIGLRKMGRVREAREFKELILDYQSQGRL